MILIKSVNLTALLFKTIAFFYFLFLIHKSKTPGSHGSPVSAEKSQSTET